MATTIDGFRALQEVEAALEMLQTYRPHLLCWLSRGDADYLTQMLTTTDRLRTALEQLRAELPR